jgi:hypothetical protein
MEGKGNIVPDEFSSSKLSAETDSNMWDLITGVKSEKLDLLAERKTSPLASLR